MAIEVDATSKGTGWKPTISHAVGDGEDRLLLVAVGNSAVANPAVPTAVKYGGTDLTLYVTASNGYDRRITLWYLLAPLSGTANVTIEHDLTNVTFTLGVVSLTGVNQVNPFRGYATTYGSSTTPSITIASAANDIVLDFIVTQHYYNTDDPSLTPGTGQIEVLDTSADLWATNVAMSRKAGYSSVTTSWTHTGVDSNLYAMGAVSIQPSAAASSSGPSQAFRQAAYAAETGRAVIALITIDHDDLTEPIRISTDPTQRLTELTTDEEVVYGTISRSNTFIFLPVTLKLPSDTDDGPGQMTVEIDNVHRQYTETIRSIFTPATFSMELVMDDDPDTVEAEWPDFLLTNIKYDATTITGTLSLELLDTEPFPAGTFSPAYFPGLF